MSRFSLLISTVIGFLAAGVGVASAHPHVWVSVKSELVYAPDGTLTAIKHHWTFDEMFSTFATQGLDANNDGKLSREELQSLAEVNVSSLKEFGYFTHVKADGKRAPIIDPKDYWLDFQNGSLTLNFTLPLKAPVAGKVFSIEVYDATYFVDFTLAKDNPVTLASAPAACKLNTFVPGETKPTAAQPLDESFFNSLAPGANFGAQFANKILVNCP
jgi:ABC-type uncharacterized transport system substrate-binding protein